MKGGIFIIVFLLILLVGYLSLRCFSYYCTVRGLLYYLGTKYSDTLTEHKAKALTHMAMERTIKEFFGKV